MDLEPHKHYQRQSFVHQMNEFLEGDTSKKDDCMTMSALTYSTAAKMRQPSLGQDKEVMCAMAEVMSFNYVLTNTPEVISKWKKYAASDEIQKYMQDWLNNNDSNSLVEIRIHSMDPIVPRSSKFYAERSATQTSYRFILPLTWILSPDNNDKRDEHIADARTWWKYIAKRTVPNRKHEPRSANAPPCPVFITRLKQSLKALESETVGNRKVRRKAGRNNDAVDDDDDDNLSTRVSPGRFGQLWRKEKRCFSNFAAGYGMAVSPGFEAVWRTIDRAKIVGFVKLPSDDSDSEYTLQNMHLVIEFVADGFVVGQIPRLISSLVAMTNEWLPQNFFDIATRPDAYMPVTAVPPNLDKRLYFQSARYHFHELTSSTDKGSHGSFVKTINPDCIQYKDENEWEESLRKLLGDRQATISNSGRSDDDWLEELRDVAGDLKQQIESFEAEFSHAAVNDIDEATATLPLVETDAPPGAYFNTLKQLRDVIENGRWPATSDARSRVIKASANNARGKYTTKKKATVSVFGDTGNSTFSSGSFTVVNSQTWESDELPLANELFPELTRSVFELEEEIIRQTDPPLPAADGMKQSSSERRSPSTHCAVNRNAQFTPHVDSGRGKGQTSSMIVGLGNYTGGETIVEGKLYDIRYNPLEFDGWNMLHWTAKIQGERYSLVFFTPDVSSETDTNKAKMGELDDERASRLAQEHSATIQSLPPLQFRPDSTDALVIKEILDSEKGSVYDSNMPDFSLKNHQCVLDIGAHIGVFSRYAISQGCQHIIAYEPEPSNFDLLRQNLDILQSSRNHPMIELHSAAVSNDAAARILVQARNENDGKQNTWRHSLEQHSQYVDRETKMSSTKQLNKLQRFEVNCVSFFGGALAHGVTFVKLDNEGAEMDILLSDEVRQSSSWLDVTHLVFEWSFTKERRVSLFHKAISNLNSAGFEVDYEGKGSWWDTEPGVLWPYQKDLVVFAHRPSC